MARLCFCSAYLTVFLQHKNFAGLVLLCFKLSQIHMSYAVIESTVTKKIMFSDGEKSDGESSGRKPSADPSPDRGSGLVAARKQTPGEVEHDVHHRTSTDS